MSDKGGVPPLQAIQPVLHFRLFAVNHRQIEILRGRRAVYDALRTANIKVLEKATEIVQELACSLRYGQTTGTPGPKARKHRIGQRRCGKKSRVMRNAPMQALKQCTTAKIVHCERPCLHYS